MGGLVSPSEMAAAFLATLVVNLTDVEIAALNTMSSDLRFLLSEYEVHDKAQLRLIQMGYRGLTTFSVMAGDRAGLRACIITDIVDPADAALSAGQSAAARLIVSPLVAAWIASSQRVTEDI